MKIRWVLVGLIISEGKHTKIMFKSLIFSSFISVILCAHVKIPIWQCDEGFEGKNFSNVTTLCKILIKKIEDLGCQVHEVTVDQCAIDDNGSCKLKRGTQYYMNMNFTPDFDGDDIEMLAFTKIANIDAEFEGMDKNACNFMTCPVVNGTTKDYLFNVLVDRSKPRGTFRVQWRMKQRGVNRCCFENKFKLL